MPATRRCRHLVVQTPPLLVMMRHLIAFQLLSIDLVLQQISIRPSCGSERCCSAPGAGMALASYQKAASEIRDWLADGQLSGYTDILLDQGYDDLSSIRRCNQGELLELLALFRSGPDRHRARSHIHALRQPIRPAPPPPPLSPPSSSSAMNSAADSTPLASIASSISEAASAVSSRQECRARVRCVYLYDDNWVERYLALDGQTIWCYPDHADQMPEFSVDVTNPRTVIKQQSATVISVSDRGQHHLLFDFQRAETLAAWMQRLHTIRAEHHPAPSAPSSSRPLPPPPPSDPEPEPPYERVVLAGQIFKKIKHTTASRRRLFCTPDLDKLVWARPNVAHDVCGFIRVITVQHVDIDIAQLRLIVVTSTRTLMLQAPDAVLLRTWAGAIRWAHEQKLQRQIQREIRLQTPTERQKLRRRRERCEDLLTGGEMFKKVKQGGGSGVPRKLACTSDMTMLQWRDETRGYVKGQICMADIAWIEPDLETRLRIVAKQRVIELDAVNVRTRDLWLEVLSFWIYLNSDRYEADNHARG